MTTKFISFKKSLTCLLRFFNHQQIRLQCTFCFSSSLALSANEREVTSRWVLGNLTWCLHWPAGKIKAKFRFCSELTCPSCQKLFRDTFNPCCIRQYFARTHIFLRPKIFKWCFTVHVHVSLALTILAEKLSFYWVYYCPCVHKDHE